MNKIWILLTALLCSCMVFAQDEDTETLSPSKKRLHTQNILEINYDGWLNAPQGITTGANRGIASYTMFDLPIIKRYLSFAVGYGFGFVNVYHNGVISRDMTDDNTAMEPLPESLDYKKNKLSSAFFDIPVEIRIRTKNTTKNKGVLRITAGAKGGICIDTHSKYKGDDPTGVEDMVFTKNKRIPNINRWRYGVLGGIGYGAFDLIGFYSLSSLFTTGQGPTSEGIRPFSIGLRMGRFDTGNARKRLKKADLKM